MLVLAVPIDNSADALQWMSNSKSEEGREDGYPKFIGVVIYICAFIQVTESNCM